MKKFISVFEGLSLHLLSADVNAQAKKGTDYFAGTWNVLLKGPPNGDSKMVLVREKKYTTTTGVVQDTTGTEISKITNIELKDAEITLYFTAQGYDVNLLLAKKDEDHVTGSLMGMFEAEGTRVKESKGSLNKGAGSPVLN
jgi:hypothetical protein